MPDEINYARLKKWVPADYSVFPFRDRILYRSVKRLANELEEIDPTPDGRITREEVTKHLRGTRWDQLSKKYQSFLTLLTRWHNSCIDKSRPEQIYREEGVRHKCRCDEYLNWRVRGLIKKVVPTADLNTLFFDNTGSGFDTHIVVEYVNGKNLRLQDEEGVTEEYRNGKNQSLSSTWGHAESVNVKNLVLRFDKSKSPPNTLGRDYDGDKYYPVSLYPYAVVSFGRLHRVVDVKVVRLNHNIYNAYKFTITHLSGAKSVILAKINKTSYEVNIAFLSNPTRGTINLENTPWGFAPSSQK